MRAGYMYWNLIDDVFKKTKRPMSIKEIWDTAILMKLDKKTMNKGKTPCNTISAMLNKRMKEDSSFVKIGSKWKPNNVNW